MIEAGFSGATRNVIYKGKNVFTKQTKNVIKQFCISRLYNTNGNGDRCCNISHSLSDTASYGFVNFTCSSKLKDPCRAINGLEPFFLTNGKACNRTWNDLYFIEKSFRTCFSSCTPRLHENSLSFLTGFYSNNCFIRISWNVITQELYYARIA